MLKTFCVRLVILLILVGCASKKVNQDQGNPLPGSSVSSDPMNFDPQGSDGQKIEGLSSIHFPFNKASLDKKETEILAKDASWLKSHETVGVQIEGHCDNRGSQEYNLALGERRARAAYDYLINLGVSPKQLSTISYGKEKPLTTDDSEEAQAKNRRDNLVPTKAK